MNRNPGPVNHPVRRGPAARGMASLDRPQDLKTIINAEVRCKLLDMRTISDKRWQQQMPGRRTFGQIQDWRRSSAHPAPPVAQVARTVGRLRGYRRIRQTSNRVRWRQEAAPGRQRSH
jgi:hypothetical protein